MAARVAALRWVAKGNTDFTIFFMDTKSSPMDLFKEVRGFFETTITQLNGVDASLPDALKLQVKSMRDGMNSVLAKMPPLDQVPAAMDLSYVMNHVREMVTRCNEICATALNNMNKLSLDSHNSLTSLNSQVSDYANRVKEGKLMPKESVEGLIEAARKQEREAIAKESKLLGERRTLLMSASAVLPLEDASLLGTEEEFTARQAEAKRRTDLLTAETGLSLNSKGGPIIAKLAWGPKEEFESQLALFKDLVPKSAGTRTEPAGGNGGAGGAADYGAV